MPTVRPDLACDVQHGDVEGTINNDPFTKTYLVAELPDVLPQSFIHTLVGGSAQGAFFYSVEATTQGVTKICHNQGKIVTGNTRWTPIAGTAIFQYTGTTPQPVRFTVQLLKGDLPGTYKIHGLNLIVRIV